MPGNARQQTLIKVICEGCRRDPNPECLACGWERFYLWDPVSRLCFDLEGAPLTVCNAQGEQVPVIRRPGRFLPDKSPLEPDALIEFIGEWVSESPVRRWKLSFEQGEWRSCLFINRFKRSCFEITDTDFRDCIGATYRRLMTYLETGEVS